MTSQKKPGRPAGAERTPLPDSKPDSKPARPKRLPVDDWADGEDMLEGLGGIDQDYDRPDDAVPPELRALWRPSPFDGE